MSRIKAKAAPHIVFREELDDRIMLYDPDTGRTLGLNALGVFIWQLLDGKNQINDIAEMIKKEFEDAPENVLAHVEEFVIDLHKKKMVSYTDSDLN